MHPCAHQKAALSGTLPSVNPPELNEGHRQKKNSKGRALNNLKLLCKTRTERDQPKRTLHLFFSVIQIVFEIKI